MGGCRAGCLEGQGGLPAACTCPTVPFCLKVASAPPLRPLSPSPQVAAAAQHHLCSRKAAADSDARLVTRFEVLSSREERLREISAMAGLPEAAVEELLAEADSPSL